MEKLKTISIKTPTFCRATICFIKDIFILFPGGASLDADHPDIKTKKRAGVKGKAPYIPALVF